MSTPGPSRRALLLVTLVVTLAAMLAWVAPAGAYRIGGARWPGHPARITFYDETPSSYRWAIEQAAAAWNTSGVGVRFVRVGSRSHASVIIRRDAHQPPGTGFATLGMQHVSFIELNKAFVDQWIFVGVVAHEMGHIIGLAHVRNRCALMTAVVYVGCRPQSPPNPWQWRCRLLQKDDLDGAKALYGGRYTLRPHTWCDKAAPPPAVEAMSVTQLTSSPTQIAKVTVTLPKHKVKRVGIFRRLGTCPTGPNDDQAHFSGSVSGAGGATVSLTDTDLTAIPAGTYCYRAWTFDQWERAGGSRTAQLDYTGPPAVPVSNVTVQPQINTIARPPIGQDPTLVDVTLDVPTQSWVQGAKVVMKLGSCPTSWFDGVQLGTALRGSGVHVKWGNYVPDEGTWCVAAFSYDDGDRYAAAGTTQQFQYTKPTAPALTNGGHHVSGSDVVVTWSWPNPVPSYVQIARFDTSCSGTYTVDDINNAFYQDVVNGTAAATWTDYGAVGVPGTYCVAMYAVDAWGYLSPVLEIQYTT